MGKIIAARAYANDEVALVAWTLDGTIQGCLGFEVTRIYVDTKEERVLAAWVPFKGQSNPDWKPQTTGVWPVQKLFWRDLTLRKRRDSTTLRPSDVHVKYRIRALVPPKPGLTPVGNVPEKTYKGDPVPLAYFDEGKVTNDVLVTSRYGDVSAAFTNGILSAQWLKHALEERGETLSADVVRTHIEAPDDPFRQYLTGDVLGFLRQLLVDAKAEGGHVRMALYELKDKELVDLIIANKDRISLILSNSSKDRTSGKWDATDSAARAKLTALGKKFDLHNRMFNNNHIGHNKFAVLIDKGGTPRKVLTGSTNWTATGLCGQSNNAMIIESDPVARRYFDYWDELLKDTAHFKQPKPLTASTSNVQGPSIRTANAQTSDEIKLKDGTSVAVWYAPCTAATTKKPDTPPDLGYVYSLMRHAHDAILFAVFMPSRSGQTSIVAEAVSLGLKDPSLLVYGAISDPTAMPNYVAPPPRKKGQVDDGADTSTSKTPQPAVFDKGRVHIVRAAALIKDDIVGAFEYELLKVGNAIIHDKIVVVDPLSEHGFVAMGSHNMGYKASYENDENLVIVRNNPELVQAYAVHVLDVYDHYRFRAVQLEQHNQHKKTWDGFLSRDSSWLDDSLKSEKGDLARYFAQSARKALTSKVAA